MSEGCKSSLAPHLEGVDFLEAKKKDLDEAIALLSIDTLEAQRKALEILHNLSLLGSQRWDSLHREETHALSREATANPFAARAANYLRSFERREGRRPFAIELGSGNGHDALFMAQKTGAMILGVDASRVAVSRAMLRVDSAKSQNCFFACADYRDVLKQYAGNGVDLAYAMSTVHYDSPRVLTDVTFPMIARVLTSEVRKIRGKLYLAMKLEESASAQDERQQVLLPDDPYGQRIHRDEGVYRIYPKKTSDLLALLDPSFDIDECGIETVVGYDKPGEAEVLCHVIATPKIKEAGE